MTHVRRRIDQDAAKLTRDDSDQNNRGSRKERKKLAEAAASIVPDGTFAKGGEALGSMAGRALGGFGGPIVSAIASKAGGSLGKLMGSVLKNIVGFGDYEVKQNSLFKVGAPLDEGQQIPAFKNVGYATRIQHREYVADLKVPESPEDFVNLDFQINPANGLLFPWLSQVAKGYQQYKLKGMIVEYRTMSSDITAGGALGTVSLATNYNVNEAIYANMLEMQNTQYATSCKPSLSVVHAIECAPADSTEEMKYVRSPSSYSGTASLGGVAVFQDNRLYDVGRFQIATEGLPGSSGDVLGQIWVSYDVEFFKPELQGPGDSNGYVENTFGATKTQPWGLGSLAIQRGLALTPVFPASVTLPIPGDYIVVVSVIGTGVDMITAIWDGVSPSPGSKYDQYNIGYHFPGLSDIYTSTVQLVAVRAIKAKDRYTYDFTTDLATATTVTGFSIWCAPIDWKIRFGNLAGYTKDERAKISRVKLARKRLLAEREARLIMSRDSHTTQSHLDDKMITDQEILGVINEFESLEHDKGLSVQPSFLRGDTPLPASDADNSGTMHPQHVHSELKALFPHHSNKHLWRAAELSKYDLNLAINIVVSSGYSSCADAFCCGKCIERAEELLTKEYCS